MTITIKDVAKRANVAPSTVSRVIANNPNISMRTKEKVRSVMEELGYYPNVNARNLVNNRTNVIGVIMPSASYAPFQNPFFPEVLRGITAEANEKRYGLYLSTSQTEEAILDEVKDMVHSRRVDGLILLYSTIDDPVIDFLLEKSFPFVIVGQPAAQLRESVSFVNNDNVKAAKMMTEYLLLLKHKRIAFIGGRSDAFVTIDRKSGYCEALEAAGIELDESLMVYHDEIFEGGEKAVIELMSRKTPPSAMIVTDDLMALGVLRMLFSMNISVPDDMSVVSFNNVLMSKLSTPPLTTLDIRIFELGYKAAQMVRQRILDPETPPKGLIVDHHLIRRATSKTYVE
jgi:DNA-binding LacI/PurR family transcriptional regulator